MNLLPDTLGDVFSFLPYRFLFNTIRMVCKDWNHMITDGSRFRNSSNMKLKITALRWMKEERRQAFWECCKAGYFNKCISKLIIGIPSQSRWNETEKNLLDSGADSLLNYFQNVKNLSLRDSKIGSKAMKILFEKCSSISTLQNITELDVDNNELTSSEIKEILTRLPNLTSINVMSNPMDEIGLKALLTNSNLKVITSGVNAVDNEMGLDKINCSQLEELTISNTDFGDEYFELLFDHKNNKDLLKNVKKLDLMDTLPSTHGFDCMRKYPQPTNITYLNLEYCEMAPETVNLLVQAQALSNLQTLLLPSNSIGGEGFKNITKCPFFKNLTKLDVSANGIYEDGFSYFGTEQFTLKNLIHFRCNDNRVEEEGFRMLFREPSIYTGLKKLKISSTEFSDKSAEYLVSSKWISLKLLHVDSNSITDTGFETLSKLDAPNLENLSCGGSQTTSFEGALYFLQHSSLPKLNTLDIDFTEEYTEENKEIVEGAEVIETVKQNSLQVAQLLVKAYPKLVEIKYDSYVSTEVLKVFLDGLSELCSLQLQVNFIDDSHIELLTNHPQTTKLKILHLGDNKITNEGAKLLANCKLGKNLVELWCEDNNITEEGWRAILSSRNFTQLKELGTDFNDEKIHDCEMLNLDYLSAPGNSDDYEDV